MILDLLLLATLATPTFGFIRFGCANNLVEERADPIVTPGQVSGHAHKIVGGSGFGFSMNYSSTQRTPRCSSCPIKEDFSNYWTPKLYYRYANGTFQSVPTVGDNMNDLNGGMTVYYLQRGPAAQTKTLKAFPEGFRMLAGDPSKRSYGGDFASKAVNYACLGANEPETNNMPNYNCPGGLRAQIFFPSCWDGKNLDSPDHRSHMSYPISGDYNNGACPPTHPVQLISLFFEVLYDTNQFANKWYGNSHPFVLANGDPTGYGFHGDFVNGWDVPVLQKVVDTCDSLADQGVLEKCAAISLFTGQQQNACRLPSALNEAVAGYLPTLPGCNNVYPGPDPAPKSVCTGQKEVSIGSGSNVFTDVTASGWAYQGCATDGDTRTLGEKTTLYSAGVGDKMTVEYCMDFCKGYTYAGLEYAGECYCGNSLAADRAPQPGIMGQCNMKCKGNTAQFCGGPRAISLYKKCSGSSCQNIGLDGSTIPNTSIGSVDNNPAPVNSPAQSSVKPVSAVTKVAVPLSSRLVSSKTAVAAISSPPALPVKVPGATYITVTVTTTVTNCGGGGY